ncbi:Mis12 protein-domain-containing protein [Fimicolochytrium jonesii]|uniref:Mis12 protein-domain-containing protein n=1 Tax=Fimicolochytrium jonesii TaxID=1396493 RepID=UPI0022FE614F|nr:Mis12 protein-domain-containing protein [Fimicolochytrium jonesii]KAI8827104.1 Mis12 protein-domain-containing protein [Fimicolochytrium jonesii]
MSARRRSTIQPPVLRVPVSHPSSQHRNGQKKANAGHPTWSDMEQPAPPPPQAPLLANPATLRASSELITELTGWAPLTYVDDVINAVNDIAYKGMDSFGEWVQNCGLDEDEAEKGLSATETLLENNIDKQFDRFELFALKNIFNVPAHVQIVLPHNEGLDFGVTAADEANADMEIEALRRQIKSAEYTVGRLREEVKATERRNRGLERMKRSIEELAEIARSHSDSNLPDSIPTLLTTVREASSLASTVRTASETLSFRDLLIPSDPSADSDEAHVRDAIIAAIERRRQKQDEMAARTPSRRNGESSRRRSSMGVQVKTGKEGLECAMEYHELVGGIGDAADIKGWREFLESGSLPGSPSGQSLQQPQPPQTEEHSDSERMSE